LRDGEVVADEVWKRFRRFTNEGEPPRGARWRLRPPQGDWWWVLSDVNFALAPGEGLGVVGRNGSGKSTLMKLIAGFLFPHAGRIATAGRVAAIVEITVGSASDLSGRDNIELLGAINGRSRRQMKASIDEIIDFSGLGDVIDRPLGFYSSGMRARLAFATLTAVDPDVLIVDEALSVGDAEFKERSSERIRELRRRGCTLLYVSHDLSSVRELCTDAIHLDEGRILDQGPVDDVLGRYEQTYATAVESEPGSEVRIVTVEPVATVEAPDAVSVTFSLGAVADATADVVVECGVSAAGALVIRSDVLVSLPAGESEVVVRFAPLPLTRGRCMSWIAVTAPDGRPLVRWQRSGSFQVEGEAIAVRRAGGRAAPLRPAHVVDVLPRSVRTEPAPR
jgi:ABC-type polysaccharide/polyol phosphate transport system ATPase subunit